MSLMDNKTWVLTNLPLGRQLVGCRWLFKVNYNADGSMARHKARLVAKGYSQMEDIDYNETFAPVAKLTSIRMLFAIAAAMDYEIHQMDVKTAFLNGDLEEEIYMDQLEGFKVKGKENMVCKLLKSLYGLKQSPCSWYHEIDELLRFEGCTKLC